MYGDFQLTSNFTKQPFGLLGYSVIGSKYLIYNPSHDPTISHMTTALIA